MFKRIKKQSPNFKRSVTRQGNYGILKNRFRYRGVMDTYLKIDAGELILHDGIRYQGEIIDDYFEGYGELYLLDGFEIKGNWKKGSLKSGHIYFNQIDELKHLVIKKEGDKTIYQLHKKNEVINIKDRLDIEFICDNKNYKFYFQVSEFRGVMIEIEVNVPMKTLHSKMYKIFYTITSSLVFKKEYIIETCSFSVELFANYKFVYTLLNKERQTQVSKVIVFSDGTVFGGEVTFYKQQSFDPFKYRSKIKSMPGYYLDLDEYDRNRNSEISFYSKFSFQKNEQNNLQGITKKQSREMPGFFKLILENLLNFSVNFFSMYVKDLLEKKQIHFDWQHFDKDYFQKIIDLKKHEFSYQKRMSRGFLKERKLDKFDWDQKIQDMKIFKQLNQLIQLIGSNPNFRAFSLKDKWNNEFKKWQLIINKTKDLIKLHLKQNHRTKMKYILKQQKQCLQRDQWKNTVKESIFQQVQLILSMRGKKFVLTTLHLN